MTEKKEAQLTVMIPAKLSMRLETALVAGKDRILKKDFVARAIKNELDRRDKEIKSGGK